VWNSPLFTHQFPDDVLADFAGAALCIFKGDLHYRRLVGDAIWDPAASFAEAMAFFPAPLLCLRTLKSDPILGLPPGRAAELDAQDDQWRVSGKYGVIQLAAHA
jgi:hypothetical protein